MIRWPGRPAAIMADTDTGAIFRCPGGVAILWVLTLLWA